MLCAAADNYRSTMRELLHKENNTAYYIGTGYRVPCCSQTDVQRFNDTLRTLAGIQDSFTMASEW
jgi:hypothetical protein